MSHPLLRGFCRMVQGVLVAIRGDCPPAWQRPLSGRPRGQEHRKDMSERIYAVRKREEKS